MTTLLILVADSWKTMVGTPRLINRSGILPTGCQTTERRLILDSTGLPVSLPKTTRDPMYSADSYCKAMQRLTL